MTIVEYTNSNATVRIRQHPTHYGVSMEREKLFMVHSDTTAKLLGTALNKLDRIMQREGGNWVKQQQ